MNADGRGNDAPQNRRGEICLARQPMTLPALSIAPRARTVLSNATRVRVLHGFDHACNLIDANGEVIALVTPSVGNGPFHLVVPPIGFRASITADSPVTVDRDALIIGDVQVDFAAAADWNPRPEWETLRRNRRRFCDAIPRLLDVLRANSPAGGLAGLVIDLRPADDLIAVMLRTARVAAGKFIEGLLRGDADLCRVGAAGMAGLGGGLTPAGDDWLLGGLLAAWIVLGAAAESLIQAAAYYAAEQTTPLSAAWLRAAARGECGAVWHSFFAAVLGRDETIVRATAEQIARQGHTSGSDALAGWVMMVNAATRSRQ